MKEVTKGMAAAKKHLKKLRKAVRAGEMAYATCWERDAGILAQESQRVIYELVAELAELTDVKKQLMYATEEAAQWKAATAEWQARVMDVKYREKLIAATAAEMKG